MKPEPAPKVEGNSDIERFSNAVKRAFSVTKDDLAQRESRRKRVRKRKGKPKR